MYKFRRRIYVGEKSMEFWFGLTSKSRDHHSNFTLFLLTENPDSIRERALPKFIGSGERTKRKRRRR